MSVYLRCCLAYGSKHPTRRAKVTVVLRTNRIATFTFLYFSPSVPSSWAAVIQRVVESYTAVSRFSSSGSSSDPVMHYSYGRLVLITVWLRRLHITSRPPALPATNHEQLPRRADEQRSTAECSRAPRRLATVQRTLQIASNSPSTVKSPCRLV